MNDLDPCPFCGKLVKYSLHFPCPAVKHARETQEYGEGEVPRYIDELIRQILPIVKKIDRHPSAT